jgi:FAD binding domain/Berberine and berberine like
MSENLDRNGAASPAQAEIGKGSEPGHQRAETDRRAFLRTAGMAAAAVVVPGALAASARLAYDASRRADTARPVWLTSFAAGPSKQDWYALRAALSTHLLIQPGQRAYDQAKQLFDPAYDSLMPAAIAYCARPSDVAACLSFVTRFKLPMRVRCGGHSYAGWSSVDKGLIIDVSMMSALTFGKGTVTTGSGIDLINFYGGLANHGVAVPGGSCPTVGISGLTLGGGVGVLARQFGLTCDALRSVQTVLADGSVVTADASQHSDLLWASKGGGGGNFGVATSFTFNTRPLSNLIVFFLEWPWSQAARAVNGWQSWAPTGPEALWSNLHLSAATGGAPQPVSIGGTYLGSVSAANRELDRLYALIGSHPSSYFLSPKTYLQAMLLEANCKQVNGCDTPPGGSLPFEPFYAKSDFFTKKLDGAGISALLGGINALRGVRGARGGAGSIAFDALGGKVNSVKPDATAFVHRDALFLAQYYTGWTWTGSTAPAAGQYKWLTSYYNALHPHASGQAYQNYIDPALKNWQQAYYGPNYGRLQLVKATYDPHDLFKFPQSIAPATLGCGAMADC